MCGDQSYAQTSTLRWCTQIEQTAGKSCGLATIFDTASILQRLARALYSKLSQPWQKVDSHAEIKEQQQQQHVSLQDTQQLQPSSEPVCAVW